MDKFQGQEAATVIYSMATSGPEDAPRGLEFPLQPKPPRCSHVPRQVHRNLGRQPTALRAGVQDAAPNEASQCVCRVREIAGG